SGLHVVGLEAGGHAVGDDLLHVVRGGDHHVVAHRGDRHLAHVLERDLELRARRRNGDRVDVVLHRIVAFDLGLAAIDDRDLAALGGRGRRRGGGVHGCGVGRSRIGRRGRGRSRVGRRGHGGWRLAGRRRGGGVGGFGLVTAGGQGQRTCGGQQGDLDVHSATSWRERETWFRKRCCAM